MKKSIIISAIVILVAIVALSSFYTVAENEYACVVEFSKIVATTDQPGIHFKVPFLHTVKYFSNATQLYDSPPSEVITLDKQNMTVDCYVLWEISDPLKFYQTLGSTSVAEQRLGDQTYKYWSFSFSIIPSKEIPGLISFRMDWLDLLAVQGTLKSLLQYHSSKASKFFGTQLYL